MPGVAKVKVALCPGSSGSVRNSSGPDVERSSCCCVSLLVHVTVVPTAMVTLAGLKVSVMLMSIRSAALATTPIPNTDKTTATSAPTIVETTRVRLERVSARVRFDVLMGEVLSFSVHGTDCTNSQTVLSARSYQGLWYETKGTRLGPPA